MLVSSQKIHEYAKYFLEIEWICILWLYLTWNDRVFCVQVWSRNPPCAQCHNKEYLFNNLLTIESSTAVFHGIRTYKSLSCPFPVSTLAKLWLSWFHSCISSCLEISLLTVPHTLYTFPFLNLWAWLRSFLYSQASLLPHLLNCLNTEMRSEVPEIWRKSPRKLTDLVHFQ